MRDQARLNGKYTAYPEYKDSGVEWLGEIPNSWDVIKIKHLSSVKRGASPRPIDDPKYFDEDGDYAWVRIADVTASSTYLEKTTQTMSELGSSLSVRLEPNQLFLSIAGTVGKPCINKIKACIHDGFVYFPELKIPNKYLFYVFAGELAYKGLGKMGTQLNLNTDTVGDIKVALPKQIEQIEQIAAFLDYETARIDSLIDKQQRLIELLKEKRQAVISHAVTKGLNPDAPMKDSGVEWLGQVPEHWGVMRLKQVLSSPMMYGANEAALDDNPDNPRFIRITDMNADGTLKQSTFKSLEPNVAKPYLLKDKDLLLARSGATVGKSFLYKAEYGTACFAGYLIKAELDKSKLLPEYAYLYSQSIPYWEFITGNQIQATIQNVSAEKYGNLFIPIPSIDEQLESIHYLQTAIQTFADFESKAQLAIELMQERRTALISAAVTGKIDLRGWTPPVKEDAA